MTIPSAAGIVDLSSEIESILEKTQQTVITKDFRINITVKDGIVDDLKITMQHKKNKD